MIVTTKETSLSDIAEWLAELATEEDDIPPGTFSTTDMADELSISESSARRRIKKLLKQGVIEPCMVNRKTTHGVKAPRACYRIVYNTGD